MPVNEIVAVIESDAYAADVPDEKPAAPTPSEAAPGSVPAEPAAALDPSATTVAFVSPVVRRIAAEHAIDPGTVPGSGVGGRVTKKDILAFIAKRYLSLRKRNLFEL